MKVSRCSAISFVSACYTHVSQSKKKKNPDSLVSLVKRPRLSHLCNMVTICNVFRLLWSHIVVTAVDLCWQLSLLCPTFFSIFFFIKRHISSHYIISEITLMCWGKNTPGILCAVCSFTQCIFFFICCPLVPGSDITDISVRPHTFTAGPPQLELYWPLWQFPCRLPTEVSGEIGWASVTTDKPSSLCGHDGKDQGNSVGRQADAFPPLFVPAAMYQTEVPSKQEFHTLLTMWLLSAAAPALINRSSSFHLFLVSFSVTSCLS